jgi:S1-C subfamily serine protease
MAMRFTIFTVSLLWANLAFAVTPDQIVASNTRSIVYVQVEDDSGHVFDAGTGFVVSHDGYVVTAAHLKVDPTQKMWAVIGQRQGTRYSLAFREADDNSDVALWQLPQSAACRYAVTLSMTPVKILDRVLALGFPGKEGLTPSVIGIKNLTSQRGFYKADGYLQTGNNGGPVFNEAGQVVAIVQGGTLPGTDNNDLIPVALAINLVKKRGVQVGIDSPAPFATSCYASCRAPAHGVEKWTVEKPWGPVDSGWLAGGHNRRDECNKLIAAAVTANPGAQIDLLPGEGTADTTGMWEESKKDLFGKVEYKYYCKGTFRSDPIFSEKQSADCGLWN